MKRQVFERPLFQFRSAAITLLQWSAVLLVAATTLGAQAPRPTDILGFEPGSDYKLAKWESLARYYEALAQVSDRVSLEEIGRSVLRRSLFLLTISSQENLSRLDEYRTMSRELAHARIDESVARRYAREGKAVVWIDAGLHATEVAPSQMMPLLAYRLATEDSPEMDAIRDNVIILFMPSMNPDGLNIVADWYEKNLGTAFETTRPPELYHHYVGHDNNRDWFMNNMPETLAVNTVLYREWYPQIVYNHHQTGPAWARIFLPPFADPVNPNIHPGVTTAVNMVGSAMANRFAMKKMPGVVSDMIYSMWWNGGMRTVPYFHNMVGLLTETSHASATPRYYDPEKRPEFVGNPRRGAAAPTSGTDVFYPYPWEGGESHLRDAVNYTMTASMAVFNIAARLKEKWLFDIYRMGRDAIEREDFHAYVIPRDQWDPPEAVNLANILFQGGVELHRADADFSAEGVDFAAGSTIVYGAQAFRPYVVDLFEPQDYPDRRRTPDGPPDPPYDLAGWTLPMQMGVKVTRVVEPFEVATTPIEKEIVVEPGEFTKGAFGYLTSHRLNASTTVVNRILKAGGAVHWLAEAFEHEGGSYPAGTILIGATPRTTIAVEAAASELGLDFDGVTESPPGVKHRLEAVKVGLYKSWVANMDEGWTRWVLENYEFEPTELDDNDLRAADLSSFDVIVLPDQGVQALLNGHPVGTMPDEYVGGMGIEGALALRRWVENGGTLVALDEASDFAIQQFGLPVKNVVADTAPTEFFIPGSLVRATVDVSHPLAWGLQEEVATSFVRSRAFEPVSLSKEREGGEERLKERPKAPAIDTIVSYAKDNLLMSGWALGEDKHIADKAAVLRVGLGQGQVILFGFRPQFRGQPRGTYKLFFNALQGASLEAMPWSSDESP